MDTLTTLEKNLSKAILGNIFNYKKDKKMYIDKDDKDYYVSYGGNYILRLGRIDKLIFNIDCFEKINLVKMMEKIEDAKIGKEYDIIVTQEKIQNGFKLLSTNISINGIGIDKNFLKLIPKNCKLKLLVTNQSVFLNVYDENTLLGIICPYSLGDEFYSTRDKLIKLAKTADAEETAKTADAEETA